MDVRVRRHDEVARGDGPPPSGVDVVPPHHPLQEEEEPFAGAAVPRGRQERKPPPLRRERVGESVQGAQQIGAFLQTMTQKPLQAPMLSLGPRGVGQEALHLPGRGETVLEALEEPGRRLWMGNQKTVRARTQGIQDP